MQNLSQLVKDKIQKVAILLCTYNGEQYIRQQLDSILHQQHTHIELWVSDDGSTDKTLAIINEYVALMQPRQLRIKIGPCKGSFSDNFLSLTVNPEIDAEYYAYADQDDIWDPNKLTRAVAHLQRLPSDVPAMYCSRTLLVDASNREIGISPLFTKYPCFANALVQNIGGGNTMVMNKAARTLLLIAGNELNIVSHDWWAYIVVTACGGNVFYDSKPTLRYRQHHANVVGMNSTWRARLRRIRLLFKGKFRLWNDAHICALSRFNHLLTPCSQRTLERFAKARNCSLFPRLWGLARSGVYRQTLLGNLGLMAASIFKKL